MCFVFSITQPTQSFSHLSCTDYDYFWNKRYESMCACIHRWKVSAQGVFQAAKTAKKGNFEGVACGGGTAQMAQFGQFWELFQGLVDIPRICLLYVSYDGNVWFWRYEPPKTSNFGNRCRRYPVYRLQTAHNSSRWCLLRACPSWFSVTQQGQHALFEPISQWVPKSTATCLVLDLIYLPADNLHGNLWPN